MVVEMEDGVWKQKGYWQCGGIYLRVGMVERGTEVRGACGGLSESDMWVQKAMEVEVGVWKAVEVEVGVWNAAAVERQGLECSLTRAQIMPVASFEPVFLAANFQLLHNA